jgi:hopanoid-associated phosphorylase
LAYERHHVTVLAVTGLKREARIAGGAGVVAVTGGGDAKSLQEKLDALHGDIKGVISVGLAGALSPLLKVGDVVIADQVIQGRETWRCSGDWRIALAARLPQAHQGPVAASETILDTAEAKAALYNATGALAVDMESALAGHFAAQRKLPFAVLRVISDNAAHALPPAALVAMTPDGGIALGRVLGSLARHPLQVPRLIATARASNKAFKQLLRCADLCGIGFARPDL